MAVDSANKRASALGIGLALLAVLPIPDAALDQGDRQQVAWSYRGINASPANTSTIELTGEYQLTVTVTGEYRPTVTLIGEYQPAVTLTGELE